MRRPCFTLTEMLVALAVLVVALAVVTSVFSVTIDTAATSAAIADVEGLVRNFAYQLQQDLEHCDPSRSILVIHGRTQAAALTEDLRQAGQYYRVMVGDPLLAESSGFDPDWDVPADPNVNGYSNPRADILMFFTNRPSASKAPPTGDPPPGSFQDKLQRGAKVSPIQVVYGHAAIDTAIRSGNTWTFADNPRHIENVDANGLSVLPATRWHLARRQALLEEPPPRVLPMPSDLEFTNAEFARIVRCYARDLSGGQNVAADSAVFSLADYLEQFAPYVNPGGNLLGRARRSPYLFPTDAPPLPLPPGHVPWNAPDVRLVERVLYNNGVEANHHVATVLERPPAALADNLGVHLLPGCAWFQVEILIPEDPRNGLDHPLSDQRRDTPRWVVVSHGQTYVFVPDSDENRRLVESQTEWTPDAPDTPISPSRLETFAQVVPPIPPYNGPNTLRNRRIRMWPYAIRVTVRVFDQRGRLEAPIVRSVVHRFD